MVSPEAQLRWQNVLKRIQNEVNDQQYNTWFSNLTLFDATEQRLTIVTESSFVMRSLASRYNSMLGGAITICFGKPMTMELILPDEADRRLQNIQDTLLNPKYTFNSFVVGSSNSYVHAAAFAVAEAPGAAYNPLFIYGGVGLGKTHLLNAIGNYISEHDPNKRILFITSESFANELIDALVHRKGTAQIRNKMRGVDVLLVDDVQFLGKTNATQEEFFHTFNELYGKGKQIVLSSDRPPREIPTLEDRLRSRFEGGLLMDIGKPDFETRFAILRKKLEGSSVEVPDDVLRYIAEIVDSNIREMEGALQRVTAEAQFKRCPVTLEMAMNALSSLTSYREPKQITPERIVEVVGEAFGVSPEDIFSAKRARTIVEPRQIAIYLTREMTSMSTLALGKAFGRDHSTIMHACDKVTDQLTATPELERRLNDLREKIRRQ